MAKLRLFEPFKKLKNYMGNLRMISCDDLFFFREHHDFEIRIAKYEIDSR